jgi:hypothetical protein
VPVVSSVLHRLSRAESVGGGGGEGVCATDVGVTQLQTTTASWNRKAQHAQHAGAAYVKILSFWSLLLMQQRPHNMLHNSAEPCSDNSASAVADPLD